MIARARHSAALPVASGLAFRIHATPFRRRGKPQ